MHADDVVVVGPHRVAGEELVHRVVEPHRRLRNLIQEGDARLGELAKIKEEYEQMVAAYEAHRKAIDALVQKTNESTRETLEHAAQIRQHVILSIVALAIGGLVLATIRNCQPAPPIRGAWR